MPVTIRPWPVSAHPRASVVVVVVIGPVIYMPSAGRLGLVRLATYRAASSMIHSRQTIFVAKGNIMVNWTAVIVTCSRFRTS